MSKSVVLGDREAAVSWGAILVGAFAAAAVSIALATLGVGTGFSLTSPWSDSGASASTLKWTAGAYLVLTAVIASTIGGYMAGRLRAKWPDAPRQETLFRDTAHGMANNRHHEQRGKCPRSDFATRKKREYVEFASLQAKASVIVCFLS